MRTEQPSLQPLLAGHLSTILYYADGDVIFPVRSRNYTTCLRFCALSLHAVSWRRARTGRRTCGRSREIAVQPERRYRAARLLLSLAVAAAMELRAEPRAIPVQVTVCPQYAVVHVWHGHAAPVAAENHYERQFPRIARLPDTFKKHFHGLQVPVRLRPICSPSFCSLPNNIGAFSGSLASPVPIPSNGTTTMPCEDRCERNLALALDHA